MSFNGFSNNEEYAAQIMGERNQYEKMFDKVINTPAFTDETNAYGAKLLLHRDQIPDLKDLKDLKTKNSKLHPGFLAEGKVMIYLSKASAPKKKENKRKLEELLEGSVVNDGDSNDDNVTILIIVIKSDAKEDAKPSNLKFGGRRYPVQGHENVEYFHGSAVNDGVKLTARKYKVDMFYNGASSPSSYSSSSSNIAPHHLNIIGDEDSVQDAGSTSLLSGSCRQITKSASSLTEDNIDDNDENSNVDDQVQQIYERIDNELRGMNPKKKQEILEEIRDELLKRDTPPHDEEPFFSPQIITEATPTPSVSIPDNSGIVEV